MHSGVGVSSASWCMAWLKSLQIPMRDQTLCIHIVAVRFLRAFWEKSPDSEQPLKTWLDEDKKTSWSQPAKIKEQYPIDLPDPVEAIKFRMDQAGLTPKDLVSFIGRLNRVYEILNRKRPLALNMIWKLNQKLGIPAERLIQPPKLPLVA